jgi:hypothetical protein
VGKDGRLILGFLWQLIELEMASRQVNMNRPGLDIYQWVQEYVKSYPGVPQDINAKSFRDGRVLSFMLHKV